MSINIKNREAEQLVAELKRHTGKGTTDLLLDLLRQEKKRIDGERQRSLAEALEQNRRIRERWRSRPLVDPRPVDGILSYDEDGLPT